MQLQQVFLYSLMHLKKSLIPCGIVGGIGWCTYVVMANSEYISNVFSMVIASAVVSLFSEIFSS